ncbi:TetR/AcrR family transcriptional regulator [Brachybacterium hainanense]|uniref:TetR/AcrR family transcriptional regulator n=1 Tax=Brachybacterium hainanense TaxID=1541174 RepID=A0ABV6R8L7_9MICO
MSRARQREETRARILEAARRRFLGDGFEATTVRAIAADVGMSVGSVMAVGDKRALLVAVLDAEIQQIQDARAGRPLPTGPVLEQILHLLAPFLELFSAHAPLAREYGAVLMGAAHRSDVFGALGEALRRELGEVLRAGDDGSAAAPAAVEDLADAVYFTYLGVLFAGAARGGDPGPGMEADLRRVLPPLLAPTLSAVDDQAPVGKDRR